MSVALLQTKQEGKLLNLFWRICRMLPTPETGTLFLHLQSMMREWLPLYLHLKHARLQDGMRRCNAIIPRPFHRIPFSCHPVCSQFFVTLFVSRL